ncbi:ArsR family transcriptional regulator [Haloferax volcanii]|uniref:ArsR family transcriptional regulator n=1 Tax=Haloferax volcanii TaxID=2246 RepID=UPI0031F32FD5|nr:ArsR family transcriptional regulator [Haloferax alexandrinus]
MVPVDDVILETLRDEGNLTPQAVDNFDVCSRSHASVRLSKMSKYGLVDRIAQGLYRLNDQGRAYLDEDLDASTLTADDADN